MGIMTRVLRLWKADMHGIMDQLEDKELLLKQYVREMKSILENKENILLQMHDTDNTLKSELAVREQEIEKLEGDITLALQKENENIAKLLLKKQRIHIGECDYIRNQMEGMVEKKRRLAQEIAEQSAQYEMLKSRVAIFCQTAACDVKYADLSFSAETRGGFEIDDEEIELELIRRKEKMAGGGVQP